MEFHYLLAKMLLATKPARPDTCTTISFLAMRVREPNNEYWAKLVHLMKYIRGTRNLPLILSANGSVILKIVYYGSFAVHPNMIGHPGGALLMVTGFPIVSSIKQNTNTQSSTET